MKPLVTDAKPAMVGTVQMFRLTYDDGAIRTEPPLVTLAELRRTAQILYLRQDHLWQDRQKLESQIRACIARGDDPAPTRAALAALEAHSAQVSAQHERTTELAAQVRAAARQPHIRAAHAQMQAELARAAAELPALFHPDNALKDTP